MENAHDPWVPDVLINFKNQKSNSNIKSMLGQTQKLVQTCRIFSWTQLICSHENKPYYKAILKYTHLRISGCHDWGRDPYNIQVWQSCFVYASCLAKFVVKSTLNK